MTRMPTTATRRITRRMAALTTGLVALLGVGHVAAQDYTFGWNPRSGDVWVDTWLGDVNEYGTRYRGPFIDEMVRYHGAPRSLVGELLDARWAPGDIYYACAIAQIIGRPCRYVVGEWERGHGEGWGALAQRLGIKPGSAEFHRLKRGFVPTYDRWSRPIYIDHDMRNEYPGRKLMPERGRGNQGRGDGPGNARDSGGGPPPQAAGRGNKAQPGAQPDNQGSRRQGNQAGKQGRDDQGKGNQGKGNQKGRQGKGNGRDG